MNTRIPRQVFCFDEFPLKGDNDRHEAANLVSSLFKLAESFELKKDPHMPMIEDFL